MYACIMDLCTHTMHTCMNACMCEWIYECTRIRVHARTCMCARMYVCIYCMYACLVYLCMHTYLHRLMQVYMYVCVLHCIHVFMYVGMYCRLVCSNSRLSTVNSSYILWSLKYHTIYRLLRFDFLWSKNFNYNFDDSRRFTLENTK